MQPKGFLQPKKKGKKLTIDYLIVIFLLALDAL